MAIRRPDSTLYLAARHSEPTAQYWRTQLAEVENINAEAKKAIDAKSRRRLSLARAEGHGFEDGIPHWPRTLRLSLSSRRRAGLT